MKNTWGYYRKTEMKREEKKDMIFLRYVNAKLLSNIVGES